MLSVAVTKRRDDFRLDARFELPGPGVVALFGRSGCGKTTLVDMLAGLLEPDSGTIRLDDTVFVDRAAGIHLAAERRRVGYVFQDARLFPHLTVRGNLEYGRKRARSDGGGIGFDEVVNLLGLEALLARRPQQLSGGERQRAALGRALLSRPRLLLLDEPLASLDAARRAEVLPYLDKLRGALSIPIVYVSHQFDEVLHLATHVVLLEEGRVLASGELAAVCLDRALRSIAGPDSIGALVDGTVVGTEASGLAIVGLGDNRLRIASDLKPGSRVRLRLLARDLILALEEPRKLSVRNALRATVRSIEADDPGADLVRLDMGGVPVVARITSAATRELELKPGLPVWVLVKSVTLRGV